MDSMYPLGGAKLIKSGLYYQLIKINRALTATGAKNPSSSNTISADGCRINGNFSLTPKWEDRLQHRYDFHRKKLQATISTSHRDSACWEMTSSFSCIPSHSPVLQFPKINVRSSPVERPETKRSGTLVRQEVKTHPAQNPLSNVPGHQPQVAPERGGRFFVWGGHAFLGGGRGEKWEIRGGGRGSWGMEGIKTILNYEKRVQVGIWWGELPLPLLFFCVWERKKLCGLGKLYSYLYSAEC